MVNLSLILVVMTTFMINLIVYPINNFTDLALFLN